MRFWITRTSVWQGHPGVDEAQEGMRPRYDLRTFKTFDEHDRRLCGGRNYRPWLSEGTEHQELPKGHQWFPEGGIMRRLDDEPGYFVEVDSLEDLVALEEKYGRLILSTECGVPGIEIYDGYRE